MDYAIVIKRLQEALAGLRDVSAAVERNRAAADSALSNLEMKTAVGKIKTADRAVDLALQILAPQSESGTE